MASVVILASGGVNSTVAASCASRDAKVNLLYADYGGPAAGRERVAVQSVAAALDAERVLTIDIGHVLQIEEAVRSARKDAPTTSADTAPAVGALPGLMPTLLLAGVQWAIRIGAGRVVCGASQLTDENEIEAPPGEGRPDRRAECFHVFNMLLESALPRQRTVRVETPLIDMSREEIVRLGNRFQAPLADTWSCHTDGDAPCGECPGCRSRDQAFVAAGLVDPAAADSLRA